MEPSAERLNRIKEEKKEFLETIIRFVRDVVPIYGSVSKRYYNPKSKGRGKPRRGEIRKLRDFNGFDVIWRLNNGEPNIIDILYTPPKGQKALVLLMSYRQGVEDCEITEFFEETKWQKALAYTATHVDDILAEKWEDEMKKKRSN